MKDIIKDRIEKIENNIVPQGYKKTEIGIIPEDWKVEKLGELGEFYRGRGILKKDIISEGVECITYGEIYTEYNYFTNYFISKISKKIAKKSIELEKGDILFAGSGETSEEIGKAIMYIGNSVVYCGSDIIIFRPKEEIKNITYSYIVNYDYFNEQKYKLSQGHSVVHLYSSNLKEMIVPVIQLKEQEKIAGILSTWDQYIENIDSIIESKKKQKKGLMQNLLTGEVRLPGFNGEWKEVKLGDVIKEVNKKTTKNNEYEILSVTKDGIIPQNKYFTKQIASKNNKGYKIVKEGNLVFSTMNLWMGSLDILKGIEIGIVSPAYKVFKIDIENFDILFLNDFMKTNRMIYLYNINSEQGASVVRRNLDLDSLLSSRINLPPIDEQVAIASVLSSADREIELLEDLRNKRMEEKKGLMQLLLTGIVRVGG